MNVAQHIERGRMFFPQKPALIASGRTMSYCELDEAANRVANALAALGIRCGDRVALLLPNCPEFMYCYLGIQKAGAVSVSISSLLKPAESSYILCDCGARAVISTASLGLWITTSRPETLEHIILTDADAPGCLSLADLCARASPTGRALDLDGDAASAILYTSGTTGFPKGAVLSHRNVISNAYAKNHHCGMKPHDRLLLFLPLFHVFGQNAVMNAAFNALATVVLCERFDPDAVAATISASRVTMFFGVPTTYRLMLARADIDLSPIRYFFSAAAPLDAETGEEWRRRTGRVIYEGYGTTETSPFACYNHEFRHKPGSVGTPIENVEVRIFRENTSKTQPGDVGEILVRGPNVMTGYWNRPGDTEAALREGWFHTGDLGFVDDEGYVFVVDRLKDMINIGGLKVYPAEVERVLRQHPSVSDAAVYGVHNRITGEEVHASIVPRAGYNLTEPEILSYCRDQLADFKVPAVIRWTSTLPRNSAGKLLKRVLREQATALASGAH